MSVEGGSASSKARQLRQQAAEARLKADRMDSMAAHWEAGEVGERKVAAALAPLVGERCRILHDRLLNPGRSKVNLDHIVVSVAGTYLVDAKNWSGRIQVVNDALVQTLNGRTRSMNDQIDKVRDMAKQMARASSFMVQPVICLAGEGSAEFGEAIQLRGVTVVPVDRLATWLLSRPRFPATLDLRSQAVRIAATFPSATEPAFLALPPRHPHRSPVPLAALPVARDTRIKPRHGAQGRTKGRSNGKGASAKTVVAIAVGLLLMTSVGQRVFSAATAGPAKAITRTLLPPTSVPATTWVPPCTGVTDAVVTKAVGVRVYRHQNGPTDTCTWGLRPTATGSNPDTVRIATGWTARYSGLPVSGPQAQYLHSATSETLVVPQFAAIPGSTTPAADVTQSILVTITRTGSTISAAQAHRAIATLAAAVGTHMPTGLGATTITWR